MRTSSRKRGQAPDAYLELIKIFPLRPLRNEAEHEQAMRMLRGILIRDEGSIVEGEQDYAEALTLIVQDYERHRHRVDQGDRSPLELLKFLMAEHGMNVNDLGRVIGSQPNASLILNGKRSLSKGMIVKLAQHFGVNPGLFL